MTAALLLLGFTGGGLQIKGLQGARLSSCHFSASDTPYEYPHQPSATDDPPYSSLFEDVCLGGGTEASVPGLKTTVNASKTYVCACCGAPLFGGEAKFDSRTGWPSFWAPYSAASVGHARDVSSVEVHCKTCGAVRVCQLLPVHILLRGMQSSSIAVLLTSDATPSFPALAAFGSRFHMASWARQSYWHPILHRRRVLTQGHLGSSRRRGWRLRRRAAGDSAGAGCAPCDAGAARLVCW